MRAISESFRKVPQIQTARVGGTQFGAYEDEQGYRPHVARHVRMPLIPERKLVEMSSRNAKFRARMSLQPTKKQDEITQF